MFSSNVSFHAPLSRSKFAYSAQVYSPEVSILHLFLALDHHLVFFSVHTVLIVCLVSVFLFPHYSYYQSSYYGSNSPSARSSLSRYGTEEPSTTTGSSSYYSKQQHRKYSRDEDGSYGDTNAMATSSPSYYSSYVGASRRPSLSRTSTLDDDVPGNEAPTGVRTYNNSAKKQLPSQVATPVHSSDTGRYGSSSSTAGSSYLRNRLAKSRSSHAIGKLR